MNTYKNEIIAKIYKISFIVLTAILGVLFILFANTIYFKGKEIKESNPLYQIYNTEIIGKYFGYLLIPFILWILLIILGIIFSYFYPFNKKKKYKVDELETYYKLKKRIPLVDENHTKQLDIIKKERKLRMISFIVVSIFSLLFMILPARYLFNPNNFVNNKPIEAINLAINVFPWIIGTFILFIAYLIHYTHSIKKELVIIKEILKTYKEKPIESKKDYTLVTNITRISVILVGVVFVLIGVINGGPKEVLDKAIAICMECIGCA